MEKEYEVQSCILENRESMIRNLCDLVAIESVSDNQEKVAAALDFVIDLAKDLGLQAETVLNGKIGVVEMGQGPETLGILTHVDVVPPGDVSLWHTDPFQGEIKDGKIFGRGTLDDKGMVIATLYAMHAVLQTGRPLRKKVRHIIGTQEEVEWSDMNAYVQKYPLPDYGFTPDGEYPICNIEKGVLDVKLEFDVSDGGGNTGGKRLRSVAAGTGTNIVPGKAVALLNTGERIEATGSAAHSCQPENGRNAIFLLAEMLKQQELAENRLYQLLRSIQETFRGLTGEKLGLPERATYYQGEYIDRDIFCPTLFQTHGDRVVVNVNIRFAYGQKVETLVEVMERYAASLHGKVVSTDFLPAVFVSRESPFLKVLAEAYRGVTGLENEFSLAYGGSYAKAMPNIVSWGPIFPGEPDTCHSADEFIKIDSLLDNACIFGEAISQIAYSGESFRSSVKEE